MGFSKFTLFALFVLACVFLLSSNQVHCIENEDILRQGINAYRQKLNLSTLTNNEKATCLADEVADALESQPCAGAGEFSGRDLTGTVAGGLVNFTKLLKGCDLEANTTFDGAVLTVCMPSLIGDLLHGNYTGSRYAKFLKDSRFSVAGVGSDDDWIVIVLATDKSNGSISSPSPSHSSSAASSVAAKGLVGLVVSGLLVFVSHLLF